MKNNNNEEICERETDKITSADFTLWLMPQLREQ